MALSLAIGIFAQPALDLVTVAARQAIDRAGYIETVQPQPLPAAQTLADRGTRLRG